MSALPFLKTPMALFRTHRTAFSTKLNWVLKRFHRSGMGEEPQYDEWADAPHPDVIVNVMTLQLMGKAARSARNISSVNL